MFRPCLFALLLLLMATPAFATTFIVPEDEQMIAKSDAIVIATIEGRYVQETIDIETVYEVRVERTLKGRIRPFELIRLLSPGGDLQDRGTIVHGAAHFANGERVLLFLIRHRGMWTTTDLTLGKFQFETSTTGARMLVRDAENIVGWDRAGRTYVERLRREAPFVRFIEEHVAGRRSAADYFVSSSEVTLQSGVHENAIGVQPHAPAFPAYTYTDNRTFNGNWIGTRWNTMSSGAVFYKRSGFDIPGAADGGVSVIQNAMASWNNECASVINLVYGGQQATPSAGQDGISMIEFNDPQGRIGGSFGGSGTVGTTFMSYWNPHSFASQTWWTIRDADVVFQDGYTASQASFPTAMTHEIGHGIGWRHSNADYRRPNNVDEPCNASIEECSNNAIMYWSAISSLGYTLQVWDVNASQAVYPGGSCAGGVRQQTPNDFNGDRVSEMVVYRDGAWLNFGGPANVWTGESGPDCIPAPGDYDGNGVTEYSLFCSGAWHFYNANGSYRKGIWTGGVAGDLPAPADYNGDGADEPAIYRNGTWIGFNFTTAAQSFVVTTGGGTAIPVPMDYDGDGRAELTLFKNGAWHFYNDNGSYIKGIWTGGVAGDVPVPGDYDGNGSEEIVVFRGGAWLFYDFNSGALSRSVWTGASSYNGTPLQPAPLDYDGDGSVDFTIFAGGPWHTYNDNGSYRSGVWTGGLTVDRAVSRRQHISP